MIANFVEEDLNLVAIHKCALVHMGVVVGTLTGFYHCFYIVVDILYVVADNACLIELHYRA